MRPVKVKPRFCAWCGKELVKGIRTPTEYAKLMTCKGTCQTSYRHHKKPKTEVDAITNVVKHCAYCNEQLVRRENEHLQAWMKRKTCNKTCAAFGKRRPKVAPPVLPEAEQRKVHVKQYTPGSPEFKQIAALYGG